MSSRVAHDVDEGELRLAELGQAGRVPGSRGPVVGHRDERVAHARGAGPGAGAVQGQSDLRVRGRAGREQQPQRQRRTTRAARWAWRSIDAAARPSRRATNHMAPAGSSGDRRAVAAVMVAAGALVAQQVAGRATRDALFLSTFHVSSLPLAMIASALVSALAVSRLLGRPRPPLAGAGGAGGAGRGNRAAARRVGAERDAPAPGRGGRLPAHGGLRGHRRLRFWSLINELFDPYTARRVMDRVGLGASLGGVIGRPARLERGRRGARPRHARGHGRLQRRRPPRALAAARGRTQPRPALPPPTPARSPACASCTRCRTCATSRSSWPWVPWRRRCSTTC